MAQPSQYELEAWREIQEFRGRQVTRSLGSAGQMVSNASAAAGDRAAEYLQAHPRAQGVVLRGQGVVAKGSKVIRGKSQAVGSSAPAWVGAAGSSAQRTVGRVARAGLSPKRVVAKHRRRGHDVSSLHDLRNLDLEQIHAVRGRASSWLYPTGAALSGAGAGLAISGGELVTAVSGGAGAAPSGAVIAGAFVGDAAAVLALSTRAVGRSALMHGYDPESPAEKLFILSVVNAGSAVSASAKTAAFTDISKLTQALARGKSWEVLNETVVAKVAGEFAKRFSFRLTKQGLGKVVPAAGIVLGGTLNWATLEGIVDAADIAYRRRFLLEKYPQLAESDSFGKAAALDANIPEDADEAISVVDEIAEAIGQPPA